MTETLDDFEGPLTALGQLLAERRQRYELVAIGGGALQLVGLITRPTRDIDVVAFVSAGRIVPIEDLPADLQRAVDDVAAVLRMPRSWFNAGPRSLLDFGLPDGLLARAHKRAWGGLTLYVADRRDQIFFKLYAAVDQGPSSKHFADLRALEPTADELRSAAAWARTHDTSEGFAQELRGALRSLGVRDVDG
jgi:hypothetical protein